MQIITNNHWRDFRYSEEVPPAVLRNYDHLSEEESCDGWIQYRGQWLHISDFLRVPPESDLAARGWHGYHGDSYFSATLIRVSEDGERVICGLALS